MSNLTNSLYNFLERIMCDALDDHEGSVCIGGGLITNFRIVVKVEEEEEAGRPTRYNYHKVQNVDLSRQDKNDDKEPKWLPKRKVKR